MIVAKGLSFFFAIESFIWITYYLLWRNFAEPVYTLYHPAEYFVLFPVVLSVQCISLAILSGLPLSQTMMGLVDLGEGNPDWLQLLGRLYFVVIVANLLSMFPATKFKTPSVVNIIGAGDVVANRMIPALLHSTMPFGSEHLNVFTIGDRNDLIGKIEDQGVCTKYYDMCDLEKSERKIVSSVIASGAPVIIATPSEYHFKYVTAFNRQGIRFAVEKPLSNLRQEIKVFIESKESFENNMFALSYYGLEKALPLTYLLGANHHFERFLSVEGVGVIDREAPTLRFDVPGAATALGRLKTARIDLLEGEDRSPTQEKRVWTEHGGVAGLAYETMIHPLILLQKILAQQGYSILDFTAEAVCGNSVQSQTDGSISFLRYDGELKRTGAEIRVVLTCGKYIPKPYLKRGGELEYEGGLVRIDFDRQECSVVLNQGSAITISVKGQYQRKYAVQMALVCRFFNEGWSDLRFDDLDDQVRVLKWLDCANLAEESSFKYGPGRQAMKLAHFLK